jgi:predicted transposase YbfD/YdcC
MPKKSAKIQEIHNVFIDYGIDAIENISIEALIDLRNTLDSLEDKRFEPYVEHLLSDIVLITVIGVMANADEWGEIAIFAEIKKDWLSTFLRLPNGIPSHDTIQRVMTSIDSTILYSLCLQFLVERLNKIHALYKVEIAEQQQEPTRDIVAIDGKTSKGSKRNKTDREAVKAMHTVSAYSTENGLCLSQLSVAEKTNEIPAVQDLIDITDIKGCVLTWDALNTQKDTVAAVMRKKGDYVGALKGNQHNFYEDVQLYFGSELDDIKKTAGNYCETLEKEQSAVVRREYFLTQDIDWLPNKKEWAGLKSIGFVRKTVEKHTGETHTEERYYIASITDAALFAKSVRCHWQVENSLHWQLDYTFKDDRNTTMEKNGAKNLQVIKKLVLALLSITKPLFDGKSLKNIRLVTALDFEKNIEIIFKALNLGIAEDL